MRISSKKAIGIALLLVLLLTTGSGTAEQPAGETQTSAQAGTGPEMLRGEPDLADIVPAATELSGRLDDLRESLPEVLDIPATESGYAEIGENIASLAAQLEHLKGSEEHTLNALMKLKTSTGQEKLSLEKMDKTLDHAIHQLSGWRKEWLAEGQRWGGWKARDIGEVGLDQVQMAVKMADQTVNMAMTLILPKLDAILKIQKKASEISLEANDLSGELDALLLVKRSGTTFNQSPFMLSPKYFSQFSPALWNAVRQGLNGISVPGRKFFAAHGWIILLQLFLSLVVFLFITRNPGVFRGIEQWACLHSRPFSAGLFFGLMATLPAYARVQIPAMWGLLEFMIGGITFARIIEAMHETTWKQQCALGTAAIIVTTKLAYVLDLPLPLFRLYVLLASILGLILFIHSAKQSTSSGNPMSYSVILRFGGLLFLVIAVAEFWGKQGFAEHLFASFLLSLGIVFSFSLFLYLLHGEVEWLFRVPPLRGSRFLRNDREPIIHKVTLFLYLLIWGFVVIPALMMAWGVYDNLGEALKGLLALGIPVGSKRVSIGMTLLSALVLYGAYFTSWIFTQMLVGNKSFPRRMEMGARISIARLLHYVIVFVGFLLALSILGVDITKVTLVLSALGVGIGFGLQAIVNNFVSGLILLFERPVRVGDYIELNGKWATIKNIGLRATTVQTFDLADLIIPNSDLITDQVTNWTLSDRRVGISIPVGVAYGSDVPLVMEKLMNAARDNPLIAENPGPKVLFLSFGTNSLDFLLRAWALDVDRKQQVTSELHQEIDRVFRESGIEISFPQLDLHIRNSDDHCDLPPQENAP